MTIEQKYEKLKNIFHEMGGVVIGFSGGVDSTLLLKVATDVLGGKVVGVVGTSTTYPRREFEEAKQLAKDIGARIEIIKTEEDKNPKFISNPPDRCYFCKTELFTRITSIAQREGMPFVADGSNVDDENDFRPGMKALRELAVRSPLREAGMTKKDVRELSKMLGLPTHDKPSYACLSSRFPYGSSITAEKLIMVESAENFMRDLGFQTVRVRHYEDTARIEMGINEMPRVIEDAIRKKIIEKFKEIGYIYITLDIEGFRSGSMNEVLFKGNKNRIIATSG